MIVPARLRRRLRGETGSLDGARCTGERVFASPVEEEPRARRGNHAATRRQGIRHENKKNNVIVIVVVSAEVGLPRQQFGVT